MSCESYLSVFCNKLPKEVTTVAAHRMNGMGTRAYPRFKVTVDLQGCLPTNHSHARLLCYNHGKVYIIVKLITFKIRRINFVDYI